MAFRAPENVQRNELVRFDLESVIRAPANAQEQQKRGWFNTVADFKFLDKQRLSGGRDVLIPSNHLKF